MLSYADMDDFSHNCGCFLAGMQQASINLTQSLHEVYEPDWHGKDDVLSIGKVRTVRTVHLNAPRTFSKDLRKVHQSRRDAREDGAWTRPSCLTAVSSAGL